MAQAEPAIGDRPASAEMALILACCRWPRSAARRDAIAAAAAAPLDWQRVIAMAVKHRVEALVHEGLTGTGVALPEPVRAELRERSVRIARRSLVLAHATLALEELLRRAGIPALFVKGSSLEMLAYRELGLKSAHDIDVLVDRPDFTAADDVLRQAGWVRTIPSGALRDDLLEPYLNLSRDAVYERSGVLLELHHRLSWHDALDGIGARSPHQDVAIFPGKTVPTLASPELFFYLAVHGATHQWMRLKWLADLAAFLAPLTPGECEALYDVARRRGAGPSAGQALRLCHGLLGTPLPPDLLGRLRADRETTRLCRHSLQAMEELRASDEGVTAGLRRFVLEWRMRRSWRSRLAALRRHLISPADLTFLPLPRRMLFVYYLARLPLFVVRRASGRLR